MLKHFLFSWAPGSRITISLFRSVLGSYGCYLNGLQTEWVKTTEMYCFMVLGAENLTSRYQGVGRTIFPLQRNLFLTSLWSVLTGFSSLDLGLALHPFNLCPCHHKAFS